MVNNETEAKSKVVRWLPDDDEDGFVILDRNKFEKVSSISILHRWTFRCIACVGVAFLSRLCWLFLCDHIVSRKSYLSTSKRQSSSRASSESCTGASSIRQVAVYCVDTAIELPFSHASLRINTTLDGTFDRLIAEAEMEGTSLFTMWVVDSVCTTSNIIWMITELACHSPWSSSILVDIQKASIGFRRCWQWWGNFFHFSISAKWFQRDHFIGDSQRSYY